MLLQIILHLEKDVHAFTGQIVIAASDGFAGVLENLDLGERMLACLLAGSERLGSGTTDGAVWEDCYLSADERHRSGEAEGG
jgi:hypothetical protein